MASSEPTVDIQALRAGSDEALSAALAAVSGSVRSAVSEHVPPAYVDAAVVEVLASLAREHSRLSQLQTSLAVETFALRAARNYAMHVGHRLERIRRVIDADVISSGHVSHWKSFSAQDHDLNSLREAIQKGLALLAEQQRQLILMHDVEGYSHEEIAHKTGISPETSRSELSAARQQLRNLLSGLRPSGTSDK